MRNLINNLLLLAPQNTTSIVLWIAAGMWLVTWLLIIADIVVQERSAGWKVGWLVLSSIPIIGGMLYAMAELLLGNWKKLFQWRGVATKKKKARKRKKLENRGAARVSASVAD